MPRTSVNQAPFGGTVYPFVEDGPLVAGVLDAYFSYEDSLCSHPTPFSLRLFGTGAAPVTSVYDADGTPMLDLDDVTPTQTPWGADRTIYEWVTASAVLRLVLLTAETFADSAVLDPRTCNRTPGRVTSLRVGLQTFSGDLEVQAGYNVDLTGAAADNADGGRYVCRVGLDGSPGAGAGRLAGCEEVEPAILRINNVLPDASGNFNLEAEGCLRLQPGLFIEDDGVTRTAEYAVAGLTAEEAAAALKLYDDCTPCCDCAYYVRTYRGLKRMWDRWTGVAAAAEAVRDTFSGNIDRWDAQRACRLAAPMRLVAATEPACKTFVGGTYCNMSKCCLTGVELRFTFRLYDGGVPAGEAPEVFAATEAYLEGSSTSGEERYAPQVAWPTVSFFLDYADPQTTAVARARVCMSCSEGQSVEVTMSAHAADPAPAAVTGEACVLPVAEVDEGVAALWAAADLLTVRAVLTRVVAADPEAPRFACDCGAEGGAPASST